MANARQIDALAKDPKEARRVAGKLLKLGEVDWTDWELDFMESMARRSDELSTRQAEILCELRDGAIRHTHAGGYRLAYIVERCWQERLDLSDDDDIEFLCKLKAKGTVALRRSEALRLRRCAVEVGVIDEDANWSMSYAHL